MDLMDQIKHMSFSLAGYVHMKTGINRVNIIFYIIMIPSSQKKWGRELYLLCHVNQLVHCHFVHSRNPILLEGFSSKLVEMFTSTRQCGEPKLLLCQFEVKVIIEGQISDNKILDNILLCLFYMSSICLNFLQT